MTMRQHGHHVVDVSSIVMGLELRRKRWGKQVLTNHRQHTLTEKNMTHITLFLNYLEQALTKAYYLHDFRHPHPESIYAYHASID